jgi:hypothetical protein
MVSGSAFTAQVAFPGGGACGTFNGAISYSGNRIEGNYACSASAQGDSGTWQMTK